VGADLSAWDDVVAGEVEVDRSLLRGVDLVGTTSMNVDASRIENCILTGLELDKLDMADVACVRLEAAVLRAYKTRLLRVQISDSRLTGVEFAEGRFEDCLFRNVKFNQAGFRFVNFKRVRFEDCMLAETDFSNAIFSKVTFVGCDLDATNFVSATCKDVDVTAVDLTKVKGVLGLKGATISSGQLMQLATLLASELGFRVEDTL